MKLRIQANSIRFRLSMTDVEKFRTEGYIEECCQIGAHTLTYALNRLRDDGVLYAEFNDGLMIVHVPSNLATQWTETDLVGLEHEQDTDGYSGKLRLAVEKDFKCVGKEGESGEKDNFPNPKSVC
jgi:hypothetical protein